MEFKAMLVSFIMNTFLSLIKIVGGVLGNSKTLIADGMHSMSDLATDIVALIGTKVSNLPPDRKHPYGHGKYEYVTSLFISLVVIILSFVIFHNSLTGSNKTPSLYVLIILVFVIVVKYFVSQFLIKQGKKYNSNILLTSGVESRYDVVSSVLALVCVGISELSEYVSIFKYADMMGGILISLLVLRIGIIFFIRNLNSLIGEADYDKEKEMEIKEKLADIKEILKVQKISLLKYGTYYILTIDIIMDKNDKLEQVHEIEHEIRNKLKTLHYLRFITVNPIPNK